MNTKEHYEGMMAGFGRTIGIDPLVLDEDLGCTLSFDNQVVNVNYSEDEESLWLFSDLGMVPDQDRAPFYQHILAANFYRKQMKNAVLSYCEATDTIVLMGSRAVDGLEQAGFEDMFKDFLDLAEALRLAMEEFQHQPSGLTDDRAGRSSDQPSWLKI